MLPTLYTLEGSTVNTSLPLKVPSCL